MQDTDYHKNTETKRLSQSYDAITLCKSSLKDLDKFLRALQATASKDDSIIKSIAGSGAYLAMINEEILNVERFKKPLPALNNANEEKMEAKRNFVISSLDEISIGRDAISQIEALFSTIRGMTKKDTRLHNLANMGMFLSEDWGGMVESSLEEIELKCGFASTSTALN